MPACRGAPASRSRADAPPSRNPSTVRANASGRSSGGRCPSPDSSSKAAPGISAARKRAILRESRWPRAPTRTTAGARAPVGAREWSVEGPRALAEPLATARREPAARRGGVLEVERRALHLVDAAPERGRDAVLVAARPVEPRPDVHPGHLVEVAALESGFLLGPRLAQRCVVVPAVDPCAHQHEPGDEIGPRENQVERDVAAHRDADDVRAPDLELVEHRGDVRRVYER